MLASIASHQLADKVRIGQHQQEQNHGGQNEEAKVDK
jgi:hypothetical protein